MTEPDPSPHSKRFELLVFLFITIFMAPAITMTLISVYGFVVWISQLIMGPPGA